MNALSKISVTTGLIVLLAGCSSPVGQETSKSTTESPPTSQVKQENSTAGMKAQTMQTGDIPPGSMLDLRATIKSNEIELSETTFEPNHVEFNLQNETNKPLDVQLVKTEIEASQLPVKDGNLDITRTGTTLVGELMTSPLEPGKTEVMRHTLEPGRYLLIAYPHGKLNEAVSTVVTVKPSSL